MEDRLAELKRYKDEVNDEMHHYLMVNDPIDPGLCSVQSLAVDSSSHAITYSYGGGGLASRRCRPEQL